MSDESGKPTSTLPEPERPGLFEAVGVEIEFMIVDAATLDVAPVCDRLIEAVAGSSTAEVELGELAWSNELVLHVLELKTNGPAPDLAGLTEPFQAGVRQANAALADLGARLLPGAVHPWMDPATQTKLWPHEYTDVYRTFDRIFGCRGHGWANLQSTHINLPFADDEEFERLHAAIRIVLPLIPALAASSPFLDGRRASGLDARMLAYRGNAKRVPSVAGRVVPEVARSRDEYQRTILDRIHRDMEPHDPEGVLRYEWVNARGAIARFDRGAIEIRVIDTQECPAADLAVLAVVRHLVRVLTEGPLADRDRSLDPETDLLADVFDRVIIDADAAVLSERDVLRVLGLGTTPLTLSAAWSELLSSHPLPDPGGEWSAALQTVFDHGPLARRMVRAVGDDPRPESLRALATDLADCLQEGHSFEA